MREKKGGDLSSAWLGTWCAAEGSFLHKLLRLLRVGMKLRHKGRRSASARKICVRQAGWSRACVRVRACAHMSMLCGCMCVCARTCGRVEHIHVSGAEQL